MPRNKTKRTLVTKKSNLVLHAEIIPIVLHEKIDELEEFFFTVFLFNENFSTSGRKLSIVFLL